MKQNEILQVSKHILLGWEKIDHKEIEGRNLTDQKQRQAVTRCMKKHLKPSVEVQMALSDVNNSLKKKKTKIVWIWIKVFLKTLLALVALMLLGLFFDIDLVVRYRKDLNDPTSIMWNVTFGPCLNETLNVSNPFVCFPKGLGDQSKFFYALAFVISPWVFYLFEYFHSDHCVNFQKVRYFICSYL